MFYKLKLKDHIRVPPKLFGESVEKSVTTAIKKTYNNFISKDLGIIIDVLKIDKIYDGTIIAGDGAAYYETEFELLSFKPELHEVLMGRVRDITDFGVFMSIGPIDGMIHISQAMDDFVSFSKDKVLSGKESKRSLKVGDICKSKVIAVSFKDPANPKIGLTMRQPTLGRLDWIKEEFQQKKTKTKSSK
jgi:DNA-directed RNA polymerase subunit E'